MPDGLAFSLYAPLAGLGDIAVGERRAGFDRPARSAILGLVAAALGFDRADEAAHAALDTTYRVAQRVRLGGTLLTDYHTVQAPQADRKTRWATRREALKRPSHRLNTLLSSRDYRSDLWVDVALIRLRPKHGGPAPADLAAALRHPAYTLYLGRKSCPLGAPLRPIAADVVERVATLFAILEENEPERDAAPWLDLPRARDSAAWLVFADRDLGGGAGRNELPDMLSPDYRQDRIERRRDRATDRRRWQFELRDEIVARPSIAEPMS